jgi:phenylacetic acid degradation protein
VPCYAFEGFVPVVDATSFVHPTACLIGDVQVGAHCYIGPGASLRGDFGRIVLSEGVNVQDNCVLHSFPGQDVMLEQDAHVGHAAVLHGCHVRRGALIGISAVLMDGVEVGEYSFVGASSFVREAMVIPARSLALGSPARVVRVLTDAEISWKAEGTAIYQRLAARCLASWAECAPLPVVEPNRPRRERDQTVPLGDFKTSRLAK